MVLVLQDEINHFGNRARFIRSSVNVKDWNRVRKDLGSKSMGFDIVMIYELSGGSTIDKGFDRLYLSGVSSLNADSKFQRGRAVFR
jgi:hypothetical protein